MVVRIKSPHSLKRAVNYNEQKVKQGKAVCIHAGNYLKKADQMSIHEKLERMQDLIARNERTKKTNVLHISINFDPSEKLFNGSLSAIANSYMEKIGFSTQPYLVYVHSDAGHPHIHVVTTNIQLDGRRIDTYNLGKNQSEKARKEIEREYGLTVAQSKSKLITDSIRPVDVQRVQYGKAETKRSITNVLDAVLSHFRFTSIGELNAVLQQYYVHADAGKKGGLIQQHGGLLYRLLDKDGKNIGVPIKASSIYNKPTLKFLEKKFLENGPLQQPFKKKLKTSIDWILSKTPKDLQEFIESLKKEKIATVIRQNNDGIIYGITFVDYRNKVVFNGSSLGKAYSAKAIQESFAAGEIFSKTNYAKLSDTQFQAKTSAKEVADTSGKAIDNTSGGVLKDLMDVEKNSNRVATDLLRKKRKKKNKNL